MTDLTETISPGNEAFCCGCQDRAPIIERDDVSGAQVPRGFECYDSEDCPLYREAVAVEIAGKWRKNGKTAALNDVLDDLLPPVSAGEPT